MRWDSFLKKNSPKSLVISISMWVVALHRLSPDTVQLYRADVLPSFGRLASEPLPW